MIRDIIQLLFRYQVLFHRNMRDGDFRKNFSGCGIAELFIKSACRYSCMQRYLEDISGPRGCFSLFHKLGPDPLFLVPFFNRHLPDPGRLLLHEDQRATDHMSAIIHGDKMHLSVLIAQIIPGQHKAKRRTQDPVPQILFLFIFRIMYGYLAIDDHVIGEYSNDLGRKPARIRPSFLAKGLFPFFV
jgi:hypothetical protein